LKKLGEGNQGLFIRLSYYWPETKTRENDKYDDGHPNKAKVRTGQFLSLVAHRNNNRSPLTYHNLHPFKVKIKESVDD